MAGPLLAADLPWLLYRSHFALPSSIKGADGKPVGALLGTVNALLTAIEACGPRAVVACTGPEEARFRVELLPRYHAHRDPMPEALRAQWDRAPALLERFGWTVSATADLEADDLLYSYALLESEAGGEALLLTGDRDLFAVVGEHVRVLEMKGARPPVQIDAAEVRRRVGVPPELVGDLIALRGDPSDGIPGAPGIGAKTAADLLARHGSLEAAIAGSLRERPRVGAALREHAAELRVYREVAALVRVDVERPPDHGTDFAGGAEAAREAGMARLATRLEGMARSAGRGGEG
jgi:5'-3' exonuclease